MSEQLVEPNDDHRRFWQEHLALGEGIIRVAKEALKAFGDEPDEPHGGAADALDRIMYEEKTWLI